MSECYLAPADGLCVSHYWAAVVEYGVLSLPTEYEHVINEENA